MSKPRVGEIYQKRYLILSELGSGGMGFVCRARQLDADREVALKSLHSESIKSDETIARFFREFKLLSRLSHPHIMTIYGMALDDDNVPFAICEYLEGRSLRSLLLQEGSLSWQRACNIVIQICDAMQFAHTNGVVHRDLKPENVMLLDQPEADFVKLVDFGLSRITLDDPDLSPQKLTFTGQLIGTAHYMSPEQIQSKADARSDIYSLGCLLFESLSGEYLFDADSPVGVIYLQSNEDPSKRFSSIKASVPAGFIGVLQKALAKNPEQRFQTMSEFSAALKSLIDDPASMVISAGELRGRAKRNTAVLISLFILLSSGLILSIWVYVVGKGSPVDRGNAKPKDISNIVLPKRSSAMLRLLSAQKDGLEKEALAEQWLKRYLNSKVAAEDKLAILLFLCRLEHSMNKPQEAAKYAKEIERILPNVSEASFEQVTQKENAYSLLANINLIHGNRAKSIEYAKRNFQMVISRSETGASIAAGRSAVMMLVLCAAYEDALVAQKAYLKKLNDATERGIKLNAPQLYMTLGDIQACNDDCKAAVESYDLIGGDVIDDESKRRMNRITGLRISSTKMEVAHGTEQGLLLVALAERFQYLDREKARQLFVQGISMIEKSQALLSKDLVQASIPTGFMILRSPAWLCLGRTASALDCPTQAAECASNALLFLLPEQIGSNADFKARRELLHYQMKLGNLSEARKLLLQTTSLLAAAEPQEKFEQSCQFAANMAELLSQRGETKEAGAELDKARLFLKQRMACSNRPLRIETDLALAKAFEALRDNSNSSHYWGQAIEFAKYQTGEPDAEVWLPLVGISQILLFAKLDPQLLPHHQIYLVVDALLQYKHVRQAEDFLNKFGSDDQLTRALSLLDIGKYYSSKGNKSVARQKFEEALKQFEVAPKADSFGAGLPFCVRCKLLLSKGLLD